MTAATLAAIFSVSGGLGYALPALVGVESMGIPAPGETALILAGVLASQGKLQIWLVLVIGISSAIIGDNIGYWIARGLGKEVLTRPGPFYHRRIEAIERGERFFERHGSKAVFLGRWVAIVRISAAWLAGISRMKFSHFFLWNALGGITWGLTVGLVAYYGGTAAADAIKTVGVWMAVAIGVAIVVGFVALKVRERRANRAADPAPPS